MNKLRTLTISTALSILASGAFGQCGGPFPTFIEGLKTDAYRAGYSRDLIDNFFHDVKQDQSVLKADKSQGFFQKPFVEFSRKLISQNRIDHARKNRSKYAATFSEIERKFGISPGVLLAFWAFETDFGAFQGDTNTLNALVTLAHDCRRPDLFRPQVLAALELYERTEFHPMYTTGAWAGEIGQVQMLPEDIIESGEDGDGDGRVDLKNSAPDALMSGAKMLSNLGWRHGEPWLQEIYIPVTTDWSETGTHTSKPTSEWASMGIKAREGNLFETEEARIILPEGRKGPAFIAYPNFDVLSEWNQSLVYILTAGYFATRLEGASIYNPGTPSPALNKHEMIQLQKKLQDRGHDVGGADGILGSKTRKAIQYEQNRLGLPADAWPTQTLIDSL